MHLFDDIRSSEAQHLVAALEAGASEVVWTEVQTLHERAEGTIKNDDPLTHCLEIRLATHDGYTLLR